MFGALLHHLGLDGCRVERRINPADNVEDDKRDDEENN
jgi:hypothetical protein